MDIKELRSKLESVNEDIKNKETFVETTLGDKVAVMKNSRDDVDLSEIRDALEKVKKVREEIKSLEETQRELISSIEKVQDSIEKDREDSGAEEDVKEEEDNKEEDADVSEEGETLEEDNKEEEEADSEEDIKGENKGSEGDMSKVFENGKDRERNTEKVKYGRKQFIEGLKTLAIQNNYDPALAEDVLKTDDENKMAIIVRDDDKVIDNRDKIEYLHKQVEKINVNAGKGKVSVIDNMSAEPIPKVAEGEPSPRAGFYNQDEFEYEVDEFRDKRDYTKTLKEDSKNGGGLVYDWMVFRRDLTRESELFDVLDSTYTAEVVNAFDELKTIKNVKLSNRLRKVAFYLDVTAFDILDRVKDANGNYLLKSDVTSATGTSLLGFPVYKYENLGEGVGYVGSIGTAVKLLDRQKDSIRIAEDLDRATEVVHARTRFTYIVSREDALVKFDVSGIQDLGVEVSDGGETP